MHLNNLKIRVPWTSILIDYQAKYNAHELPRRFPQDSAGKLTAALVDAQLDLNLHQIDAALFAFKSLHNLGSTLPTCAGKMVELSSSGLFTSLENGKAL